MASLLENPATATDLISFLKGLPDCRLRRGIRYPQWWMLLVAILAILSNQGSLLGMERFAKRHRKTLNQLLGTHIANPPSDSTFRLLLSQGRPGHRWHQLPHPPLLPPDRRTPAHRGGPEPPGQAVG